jgi:hypothetical protein
MPPETPEVMGVLEVTMLRKLFAVAFLGSVISATLATTGCASDQSNSPTGDRTTMNDNWRYTDDKGHYRPEWRANPPAGYPKG